MSYRPGQIPEPTDDLKRWAKELASRLRSEFSAISRMSGATTTIERTVNVGGSSVTVSSYGNRTAVTTAGTYVPLKTPMVDYIVLFRCLNSSNDFVGCDLSNFTSAGFTATPIENGTLHWTPVRV